MTQPSPAAAPDPSLGRFDPRPDPRVPNPGEFSVVFIVLLDGDLVMTPEHLGVASMAAVLRRSGFRARIVEVTTNDAATVDALVAEPPDIVCLSLMTLNVPHCAKLCAALRQRLPELFLAAGGPAATFAPEALLEQVPELDALARGEGEPTILALTLEVAAARLEDRRPDLAVVAGVAWWNDGNVHTTPLRPLLHNLDDLPFPARDQFEAHGGRFQYLRISTSRGCVARCAFCGAPNLSNRVQPGKPWRARSPTSVVDELEHLVNTYGFRTFDFVDSTFEDPDGGRIGKTRVRAIAEEILRRKLEVYFNCCMRAENWTDTDGPLLDLLARAGMEKVNVGIESGCEEELRLWEKRATVEDNARVIRLLTERGVYLAMGFIQFHPWSTVDTLRRNAAFLHTHAGFNLRRLTERLELYPGTTLALRLRDEGLLDPSFEHTLDPFAYRYRDPAVARAAEYFASLFFDEGFRERGVITESSAVYEFETFNVVVETWLSRIRRRFGERASVGERLDQFRARLTGARMELADFNKEFFDTQLGFALAGQLPEVAAREQCEELERLYSRVVDDLRTAQLQLSRGFLRDGVDVREVASTRAGSGRGAPRTYTGGAPCW